ncbi:heterogeneous nuclear ribonucleoprotein A/B-like protein [Aphelenchoides avenae]|nr:heterogeneous nuclear ribonucleoprotein A/B-like protein [Aphelenchus avenae]
MSFSTPARAIVKRTLPEDSANHCGPSSKRSTPIFHPRDSRDAVIPPTPFEPQLTIDEAYSPVPAVGQDSEDSSDLLEYSHQDVQRLMQEQEKKLRHEHAVDMARQTLEHNDQLNDQAQRMKRAHEAELARKDHMQQKLMYVKREAIEDAGREKELQAKVADELQRLKAEHEAQIAQKDEALRSQKENAEKTEASLRDLLAKMETELKTVKAQLDAPKAGGPQPVSNICTGRKLVIRQLSLRTTSASLGAFYARFGNVVESHVLLDKVTQRSRGFGFVTFATVAEAQNAFKQSAPVIDGKHAVVGFARY